MEKARPVGTHRTGALGGGTRVRVQPEPRWSQGILVRGGSGTEGQGDRVFDGPVERFGVVSVGIVWYAHGYTFLSSAVFHHGGTRFMQAPRLCAGAFVRLPLCLLSHPLA
jgi:hypothetical protein